jgi:hypothetical protein
VVAAFVARRPHLLRGRRSCGGAGQQLHMLRLLLLLLVLLVLLLLLLVLLRLVKGLGRLF